MKEEIETVADEKNGFYVSRGYAMLIMVIRMACGCS